MVKRKSITKKIRFEVFKRDSFICQYCGKSAPDVILEIDHLKPVSKGGDNNIMNLITSCFDCNRGKGSKKLNDNSVITKQKSQLDLLNKKREQIEMISKWKTDLIDLDDIKVNKINSYISKVTDFSLNDTGKKNIKKVLLKNDFVDVFNAVEIAFKKYYRGDEDSFNYAMSKLGGIIYLSKQPEEKKKISYIKGICRNRFNYFDERKASIMLNEYFSLFDDYDDCIEYAKNSKNWSQWYNGMINYMEENSNG